MLRDEVVFLLRDVDRFVVLIQLNDVWVFKIASPLLTEVLQDELFYIFQGLQLLLGFLLVLDKSLHFVVEEGWKEILILDIVDLLQLFYCALNPILVLHIQSFFL